MTRINVGIDPRELPSKLLLAEHREIKRIPNCIKSDKCVIKNIPVQFTLGKGHVKFFYDKLGYLKSRYDLIYKDCMARKFKVEYYGESFEDIPQCLMGTYEEAPRDRELLIERIESKGF